MQNENDLAKSLITIRDYIRYAITRFTQTGVYYGHGTDNAWDEAIALIFYLLHIPADTDREVLDAKLSRDERQLIIRMIETRCIDRVPVPYITGLANFAGLSFIIDERALIPRSPIAELIENDFSPWLSKPPTKVLDLCCGSGCIGIATSIYLDCESTLSDMSSDALELARRNVAKFDLQESTKLIQGDLFDNISGEFDLIISNPPYVDEEDLESMPAEYRHEPIEALAAGDDGLSLATRILQQAEQYLTPEGSLIMELGNSWVHLETKFPKVPWTWIEFSRGGHGVLVISKKELNEYF